MTPRQTSHTFTRAGGTVAKKRQASWVRPLILIAEDDADSREMLELLLQNKGYGTLSADDGPRALELAMQRLPNMVLIDLQLPKRDGLMVARDLRAHSAFRKVPIIIISGYDPGTYKQAALNAGCNDYLLKPIDFERLDQILNEMLPHNWVMANVG